MKCIYLRVYKKRIDRRNLLYVAFRRYKVRQNKPISTLYSAEHYTHKVYARNYYCFCLLMYCTAVYCSFWWECKQTQCCPGLYYLSLEIKQKKKVKCTRHYSFIKPRSSSSLDFTYKYILLIPVQYTFSSVQYSIIYVSYRLQCRIEIL